MRKYYCLILAVCFLCGCDDEKDTANHPACSESETRCTSDGQIETCAGGVWGAPQNCPAGETCTGKTCGTADVCTNSDTRCTSDGQIETCAGGVWGAPQNCPAGEGCFGSSCAPLDGTCSAGTARCMGNQIQYCESGSWGFAKKCPVNKECRENACVTAVTTKEKHALVCGNTTCTENQLCRNNTCVNRNARASQAGDPCDPNTFLESCDGNTLVYCKTDSAENGGTRVEATPCSENEICALQFNRNLGYCAREDVNCNANTAGTFPICYDSLEQHYVELNDCALAGDGYYYAFRTEMETVDCLGACVDGYSCDRKDEPRACAREGFHCEGSVSVECVRDNSKLQYISTNCADYAEMCSGIACLPETGECDWNKCSE